MNTRVQPVRAPDDEDTPTAPEPWTLSTTAFELRATVWFLTPEQRAAVLQRPRFHSMPWLVPAGTTTHPTAADELP